MSTRQTFEEFKAQLLQEGWQKGWNEGWQKGWNEVRRENILKIVSRRWPKLLVEATEALPTLVQESARDQLFDALLDATDIAEARAAFSGIHD